MTTPLPELIAAWCETIIGDSAPPVECSHLHGESRVWRIQASTSRETYYLKAHRRDGKREREIWAYNCVVPLIGEFAPRLVAVRDEPPPALLFSALPGEPMDRIALTAEQERSAWRQAGTALSRYHSVTSPWFGRPDRNGEPMEGTHPRRRNLLAVPPRRLD